MKIMVCGSIGHGGIGNIRYFQSLLKKEGFNIIDHISAEGMDYSDTRDFRDKKDFSFKIVNHDLEYVKESVPTPWPVNFSDYTVTAEQELITLLRQLETY